jgi:16S rRNA (guanine527-N7)-methyltransferase
MAQPADLFERALRESMVSWSINVTDGQLLALRTHYDAMIETNQVMNLTRITDPIEAAVKHYADSLAVLPWIHEAQVPIDTVLDIGTGAGFPAVPLAVMRPDWRLTAIDGTRKKVDFLNKTVESIGLRNLVVEHAHSTHWRPGRRFDLVVARAVGSLVNCLHALAPHARHGGWVVVYKTPTALDEMEEVEPMLRALRLKPAEPFPYQLTSGSVHIERLLVPYQLSK